MANTPTPPSREERLSDVRARRSQPDGAETSLRLRSMLAFDRKSAIRWAFTLARQEAPRLFAWTVGFSLVTALLPTAIAWVSKAIVDHVAQGLASATGWADHKHVLGDLVLLEAALAVALLGAGRALSTAQTMFKSRLGTAVQERLLRKYQEIRLEALETQELQDRWVRARREAGTRPADLLLGILALARNAVLLVASVIVLLSLSWWAAALVVIAGLPAFVVELRFSSGRFSEQARRSQEWKLSHYLESTLSREDAQREIRTLNVAGHLLARFAELRRRLERTLEHGMVQRAVFAVLLGGVGSALYYYGYYWIIRRTVNEHLTLGQMTLYLMIFRQAQGSVASALTSVGTVFDEFLYLQDVRDFLEYPVEQGSAASASMAENIPAIEANQLSFRYPDSTALSLRGLDVLVSQGEFVVIVGANGSGKSTLLSLVLGLYAPGKGSLRVCGQTPSSVPSDVWLSQFAVVFQEPLRLKLTALENLALEEERDFAQLARELGLGFVGDLQAGWRTQLGKAHRGGRELSGGEWQRMAILRALLRKEARFLLLDEPTSALDPRSEDNVIDVILKERGKRTVLFVTHRLKIAPRADRILVMDNGVVVESGSHHVLLERDGAYAHLWRMHGS